jgi:Cu+-exporting ATPase
MSTTTLTVTGMTCAGCAGSVTRAVGALPGAQEPVVNLALERLDVAGVDAAEAGEAIRRAGFGVRLGEATFKITGMTCANCAGRVEKALRAAPGVVNAEVNIATDTAHASFAPEMTTPEALADVIGEAGYTAHLPEATGPSTADQEEARAARRDRIELIAATLLTAPLVLQMGFMMAGTGLHLPVWAEVALATPVQFWIGRRFYLAAWRALKARSGNMDQLVVTGTSAAYFYSLWQVLTLGNAAAGQLYFEGAAVVITLVLLGKVIEARAKRSASAALRSLMTLRPDHATVLRAGEEVTLPIGQVMRGDILILRPGERAPVDGTITRGTSELDESLVTGESMPVTRTKGDPVVAGAINGSGLLRLRAERIGADTTLARIARMVEQAQVGKAPIQRLVDRISAVFVPAVLVFSLAVFGLWMLVSGDVEQALTASVSVLVIACPCALGLATPTALVAGTGAAAQAGIVIRDIATLERARGISVVAFDKTGTLTEGRPVVTDISAFDGSDEDILRLAATAQQGSEHPLGRAILTHARDAGLKLPAVAEANATIGAGIEAMSEGHALRVGRADYAAASATTEQHQIAAEMAARGQTVVWIGRDGQAMGLIALADQPRAEAKAAIDALHARGVKTLLLTGDNAATAKAIASTLGLDDIRADLHPGDKAEIIAALEQDGQRVAMVGDGINDTPALAAASLGIAMGSGTDAAMEVAGVTLLRINPALVADALSIAEATGRKIKQNLGFAFVYNVICLPIAAFGLLSPALAGAAMALSSLSVVSNALLLKRWRARA